MGGTRDVGSMTRPTVAAFHVLVCSHSGPFGLGDDFDDRERQGLPFGVPFDFDLDLVACVE